MENTLSKKSLYQLTAEMSELFNSDSEISEELMEKVFGDIQTKAENTCHFITQITGEIAMFKAEEERLKARRTSLENLQTRIKERVKQSMENLEMDSLKAGTFTLSLAKTAGSTVIDDLEKIPAQFLTYVPAQCIADKTAIKAAIKAGETVTGAHVEQSKSLRIK